MSHPSSSSSFHTSFIEYYRCAFGKNYVDFGFVTASPMLKQILS